MISTFVRIHFFEIDQQDDYFMKVMNTYLILITLSGWYRNHLFGICHESRRNYYLKIVMQNIEEKCAARTILEFPTN